jgi:hypothetical protein
MYISVQAEGLVPMCRVAPANETVYAQLEIGRRIEVAVPPEFAPAAMRELLALGDIPGSDCPVPLAAFKPQLTTPAESRNRARYEFAHFPSATRFELLRLAMTMGHVQVPDRGEVVLERD